MGNVFRRHHHQQHPSPSQIVEKLLTINKERKSRSRPCGLCGAYPCVTETQMMLWKHDRLKDCGHSFCWNCIYEWTKRDESCPKCCKPADGIMMVDQTDKELLQQLLFKEFAQKVYGNDIMAGIESMFMSEGLRPEYSDVDYEDDNTLIVRCDDGLVFIFAHDPVRQRVHQRALQK